jgi:hypothetical protein
LIRDCGNKREGDREASASGNPLPLPFGGGPRLVSEHAQAKQRENSGQSGKSPEILGPDGAANRLHDEFYGSGSPDSSILTTTTPSLLCVGSETDSDVESAAAGRLATFFRSFRPMKTQAPPPIAIASVSATSAEKRRAPFGADFVELGFGTRSGAAEGGSTRLKTPQIGHGPSIGSDSTSA